MTEGTPQILCHQVQSTWREFGVILDSGPKLPEMESEPEKMQTQKSGGAVMKEVTSIASDDVVVTSLRDRDLSIKTLTLAFSADPFVRFCYPNPVSYLAHFPNFTEVFGGKAFTCGSAYHSGEFLGTALWLPPDTLPDERDVLEHFERTLDPSTTKTAYAVLNQLRIYQPEEPHWYLALLGVDVSCQGRGIGTKLLQPMIDKFDRTQCLAYLESTNAANIPLYERFGFNLVGSIEIDDCPPLFPMVRRPQDAGRPRR